MLSVVEVLLTAIVVVLIYVGIRIFGKEIQSRSKERSLEQRVQSTNLNAREVGLIADLELEQTRHNRTQKVADTFREDFQKKAALQQIKNYEISRDRRRNLKGRRYSSEVRQ